MSKVLLKKKDNTKYQIADMENAITNDNIYIMYNGVVTPIKRDHNFSDNFEIIEVEEVQENEEVKELETLTDFIRENNQTTKALNSDFEPFKVEIVKSISKYQTQENELVECIVEVFKSDNSLGKIKYIGAEEESSNVVCEFKHIETLEVIKSEDTTITKLSTEQLCDKLDLYKKMYENLILPDTVEELEELQSDLSKNIADVNSKRMEYFKDIDTKKKAIIALEKLMGSVKENAGLKRNEILKDKYDKIKKLNIDAVNDYISELVDHDFINKYIKFFNYLIHDEKKGLAYKYKKDASASNILNSKDVLLPKIQKEIKDFVDKVQLADSTLNAVGIDYLIKDFNSTKEIDIVSAQKFQKEQEELLAQSEERKRLAEIDRKAREQEIKEREELAKTQAKEEINKVEEEIKEEQAPDYEEVVEKTYGIEMQFIYDDSNAEVLKRLLSETQQSGIKVKILKPKYNI